jgi:hypothetical protein
MNLPNSNITIFSNNVQKYTNIHRILKSKECSARPT